MILSLVGTCLLTLVTLTIAMYDPSNRDALAHMGQTAVKVKGYTYYK